MRKTIQLIGISIFIYFIYLLQASGHLQRRLTRNKSDKLAALFGRPGSPVPRMPLMPVMLKY
jgi:hypothetical protein